MNYYSQIRIINSYKFNLYKFIKKKPTLNSTVWFMNNPH